MIGVLIQTLKKNATTIAALLLTASFVPSAKASFSFDPTGNGTTYTTTGLGFGPGNALAVGSIPLTVGAQFQVDFQTHLTSLGNVNFVAGLNQTFQVTEVATFTEVVTSITTSGGITTATFALVASAPSAISIYENNAVTFNDGDGTGFTDGTKIASLTATSFVSSQFSQNNNLGLTTFNPNGTNGYASGAQSVQGSGSSDISGSVSSYNSSFFTTPMLSTSLVNLNVSAVFDSISASALFTNAVTNASVTPNIGAVNGVSGPDFQFQVSGFTQSFAVAAVPEPASVAMTLIGFGGAGLGAFLNRRKKSAVSAA